MTSIQDKARPTRGARPAPWLFSLLMGAFGSAGCSDEAPTRGTPLLDSEGPAFVVSTRVWDDVSTQSYFQVLPSLSQDVEFDPSKALEVSGSARLFAFEGIGWFAIGAGDEPTITRYTLSEQGELQKGESLSFQPFGVQSLWPTMYFVSPTKAYYPDRAGHQLVAWNPTTMKVTGRIALPETERESHLAVYGYDSVLRGKTLLFSVGWFDWQASDTILPGTGLVAIDTETDTVARYDVDDRCSGITQSIQLESGDAYFVSSALAAAGHRFERVETEPCALRILKDADAFEPDYRLPLGELTNGAAAGDPIPAGGNELFLRVLDDALATIGADGKTFELTSAAAWTWWRWNPEKAEAAVVSELDPSPANVSWFAVDGSVYTIIEADDSTQSTLINLTADGGPKLGPTIPGYLHALARVR